MHSLSATLRHPEFRAGARDMAGPGLGLAAWGLVTGVAMVKGGLPLPLALLMNYTVFSGGVQLAALPLMMVGAPVWVIWATALCMNLRFVIFSIQWRPFFRRYPRWQRILLGYLSGDLTFVLFMKRFPAPRDAESEFHYYLGINATNWLSWQVPATAGMLLANIIPPEWGLGFAGVLALLGLTYSLLSDRATTLLALVAAAAAIAAFALPMRLHIVVAIAAGVCVGLLLDGASKTSPVVPTAEDQRG